MFLGGGGRGVVSAMTVGGTAVLTRMGTKSGVFTKCLPLQRQTRAVRESDYSPTTVISEENGK